MTIPVITTKLYRPPVCPDAVLRPHLVERLNAGLHRKLTLVSAAAGFGKTTLVSAWVAGQAWPVAWLSLDAADSDPVRFLTYLIAALQTAVPTLGDQAATLLQSGQPPTIETILTTLLNDVTALDAPLLLVLDDYHALDAPPIDHALTFFLDYLPPHMHLVIATREDPQFPLARWRVQGQLTEIRVADLRFRQEEAAQFLKQMMGLDLSADVVAALEHRTEGWIAGLQMAALSMQGRDDTAAFMQSFTGNHRFVLDYLVQEVLQRQPDNVRQFLLQTSILSRLSVALCDAVSGRDDSRHMLDTLERDNLFVIPLDDTRQWYRYHHLFADALQAHLLNEQAAHVADLHGRASHWYEQHDLPLDAIYHALAADDFERAADLLEWIWPVMDQSYQSQSWVSWLRQLPEAVINARPMLNLGYAWAFLNQGDVDAAEARLSHAEQWLNAPAEARQSANMVVLDEAQFRLLPAAIASARAYRALTIGDTKAAIAHTQHALTLTSDEAHASHRQATALLALAYWADGDLETADQHLLAFMHAMQRLGILNDAVGISFMLADVRLPLGRLRAAFEGYGTSLAMIDAHSDNPPLGTCDVYRGLSELYVERNELDKAAQYLQTSQKWDNQAVLTNWHYRLHVSQARLQAASGDYEAALASLQEAERAYTGTPAPDVRPVAALRACLWIKLGRLNDAMDWARGQGLWQGQAPVIPDDMPYMQEFNHITLARLLLARHKTGVPDALNQALVLLARLLQSAQASSRQGSAIEILILQALAHDLTGDTSAALTALELALRLAEPEGFVRRFLDEGEPMKHLLTSALGQGILPTYTGRLVAAFGASQPTTSPHNASQPLIEPLSERELEILQFIAAGLSNREIADRLYLALSTVKGHNRNIFGKLQVQRRTEAVARARELGLL